MVAEHKSELSNQTHAHNAELKSHAAHLDRVTEELKCREQSHAAHLDKINASHTTKYDKLNQKHEQLMATNQALILNQGPGDKESVPGS